ncbi:hypothetical protein [Paenibacillus thiaminolyticus]|uniref:hypothetical protein n=1 Tax=Paenibacillus thiaminolyticus TaxID=49283 RepID=UPI002542BE29|nr:hypothetical protein [Paenibacillus thiaminolyticus]WII37556.1 hypothetical protein O0V01_28960 [Paenibacillus thiaminolyticus]
MKRKGIAQDTLRYMQQGYYELNGRRLPERGDGAGGEPRRIKRPVRHAAAP